MIPGDDPEAWNLLHDGRVTAIVGSASATRVTVEIPHIGARFEPPVRELVVTLHEVESLAYLPYSDRWDEPELGDHAAIVAAKPDLTEAAVERGVMTIWGGGGSLRLGYAGLDITLADGRPVTLAQLREAVARYWQEWALHWAGKEVHPLVRAAVREPWTRAGLDAWIDAWRIERSTDLAETIVIVDEALGGAQRDALAELATEADASWDLLLGPAELAYAARERLVEVCWQRLGERVAALCRACPRPDPRVGRCVEAMLRGPSGFWFSEGQVDHVIGPGRSPSSTPSFADHALALLDTHADAGTAGRLVELARRMRLEADCNDAEMAERLEALAEQLAARWTLDRALPKPVEQALRRRLAEATTA